MSPPLVVGWYGPSDGPWEWIQSQFANIRLLDDSSLEEWVAPANTSTPTSSKILLVAMENRSDIGALARVQQIIASTTTSATTSAGKSKAAPKSASPAKRTPTVHLATLLGNDWHGHRRTYPIPEGIPSFYWYQWYDRVFPWVSEIRSQDASSGLTSAKRKMVSDRPNDTTAWRVQWTLDRSRWLSSILRDGNRGGGVAWVLTDHADGRELWRDACEAVGLRLVSSHLCSDPPWLNPDLIAVDCVSRSEDSDRAIEAAICTSREQHPHALLALVTPFPTWPLWSKWQSLGVDAILPRPAALQGFLLYWRAWQSEAPA